jgi:hypothetical protein
MALVAPVRARGLLDRGDAVERGVEHRGKAAVDVGVVVVGRGVDPQRLPSVPAHEVVELLVGDAGEHGRVGDLVAVQMQDRQHGAVRAGVQELVGVPAGRERAGLGLAVTDDARDHEAGVVERRAERMGQRVAELTAFVDRAGCLGGDVAGDPARERELTEELLEALLVASDVRVDLAVGALQIGVRDQPRAAVAGPGHVQHLDVAAQDRAVQVRVDQVEAGRRAKVPQQARLDVLGEQRLP